MKRQRIVGFLLTVLLAILAIEADTEERKAVPLLTIEDLRNATYKVITDSEDGSLVKLVDGEFKQKKWPPEKPDYPFLVRLTDWVRFADLNGDSIDDAAVIYYWSGGGSGSFYWLGAVLNDDGKPLHIASAHLGDRVKIESLAINSGGVFLEMTPWESMEAACCPTSRVERNYKLRDEKLVESTDFTGDFLGEIRDGSGARMFLELNIMRNRTATITRKPVENGRRIRKEGTWWPSGDGSIEIIFPKMSEDEGEDRISCYFCKGKLTFCTYYEYIYGSSSVSLERVSR